MPWEPGELLDCVDQHGHAVSPLPRSICHGRPEHLHRVIHVIVEDDGGRMLLQKRSMTKDIQPGRWDTAVGGHLMPGEEPAVAAVRECVEELGLEPKDLEYLYEYIWVTDWESEWVTTFRVCMNGPFSWDREEIDQVRFWDPDDVAVLAARREVTPNFEHEYLRYRAWQRGVTIHRPSYPIYDLVRCMRCPRLVAFRESIRGKGNNRDAVYWNRPVPGFGDPEGSVLIVGLAPGAHGANRTGRPFTGDAAGELLFRALEDNGLSNGVNGRSRGDGLRLFDTFIVNAVKCVPPDNRPLPQEIRVCSEWLAVEIAMLHRIQRIVCLGRVAFDAVVRMMKDRYPGSGWEHVRFSHGCGVKPEADGPSVVGLYHPSRRNLNTGLLTVEGFLTAFRRVIG
ncbi:NUDIX domain-containing protein [bacterium]|nr:NUDIX domain-containing protein [candidate division CSSED10-310 bacterium]